MLLVLLFPTVIWEGKENEKRKPNKRWREKVNKILRAISKFGIGLLDIYLTGSTHSVIQILRFVLRIAANALLWF